MKIAVKEIPQKRVTILRDGTLPFITLIPYAVPPVKPEQSKLGVQAPQLLSKQQDNRGVSQPGMNTTIQNKGEETPQVMTTFEVLAKIAKNEARRSLESYDEKVCDSGHAVMQDTDG
jgi:hypothetical protein